MLKLVKEAKAHAPGEEEEPRWRGSPCESCVPLQLGLGPGLWLCHVGSVSWHLWACLQLWLPFQRRAVNPGSRRAIP